LPSILVFDINGSDIMDGSQILAMWVVCAGAQNAPSPGGESLSHTELYMKYVDATQQCRQERAYRRRNEVLLEQVNIYCFTAPYRQGMMCSRLCMLPQIKYNSHQHVLYHSGNLAGQEAMKEKQACLHDSLFTATLPA